MFKEFSIFKFAIGVCLLVIAYSFFNYFVLLPNKKYDNEQVDKLNRELSINSCLGDAEFAYFNSWREYCAIDHEPIGKDGLCLLDSDRADYLTKTRDNSKDRCYRR